LSRISNRNFRKLRDIKRLDQSLTNESKRIRGIENDLSNKLTAIANEISKFTSTDIALLQRVFEKPVTETIRAALQKTYITGMNYTAEFFDTDGFLTQVDLDNIRNTTAQYVQQFWRFVDRGILHRNDLLLRDSKGQLKPPKEPLTDAGFVASAAVVRMMNVATIMKAKQLRQKNRQNVISYRFAALDLELFPTSPDVTPETEVRLIWKTADDLRVCPICDSVADEVYELDDPLIPVPPEASHPNCRCRLMLTEVSSEGLALDVPFEDTEQSAIDI